MQVKIKDKWGGMWIGQLVREDSKFIVIKTIDSEVTVRKSTISVIEREDVQNEEQQQ